MAGPGGRGAASRGCKFLDGSGHKGLAHTHQMKRFRVFGIGPHRLQSRNAFASLGSVHTDSKGEMLSRLWDRFTPSPKSKCFRFFGAWALANRLRQWGNWGSRLYDTWEPARPSQEALGGLQAWKTGASGDEAATLQLMPSTTDMQRYASP